jgi:tetratricopeptide (TPR) repeat protein
VAEYAMMDPKQQLLRRYLDLSTSLQDRPEVAPELVSLRAEAASAGDRQWQCFLDGRIAFVRRDYPSALASFEAALGADPDFALALHMQAVCLGGLGRHEEALAACEKAVSRFGDVEDPALRQHLAKVMVKRGATLGELGRHEESIAAYDEVISRFGDAEEPALREAVAEALSNKRAALLGKADRQVDGPDARDQPPKAAQQPEEKDEEAVHVEQRVPQDAPCSPGGLVERIHATPGRVVLVVSGGGSRAIAELLEVPGASRTLLEAAVPYSEEALVAWLGGRPEAFCSARAARAMAMVAFRRAWEYDQGRHSPAGVACTASLATDRPKRGAHRAHVALQTARRTATWSLQLQKGRRSRAEEEQLVCRLLINTLAEACRVDQRLPLDLLEGEQVDTSQTLAPRPWQELLLGRVESVCPGGLPVRAVFPGAFNPLHAGHRRMAQIAGEMLDTPVAMEISILNVDKPPLDYQEIERRLDQFAPDQRVCLTRAATFEEKSALFPGATFIVGLDTLRRIADPRYYADDCAACLAAIQRIAERGCRFLVFGRNVGTGFMRLSDLDLPDVLRSICREVPAEEFREDVSSTEIRKSGKW